VDITVSYNIQAWTKFDFVGRGGKYSAFTYNKSHFNGTDWNENDHRRAIYRFVEDGKDWAQDVGSFQGNADYLMLENLDYTNAEVVSEVNEWGKWITKEFGLRGFRLDAVQHYSRNFVVQWAKSLSAADGKRPLFMGEYWSGDVHLLTEWLDQTSSDFYLFDVPLMGNLAKVSLYESIDLRDVFRDTLVERRPHNAIVSAAS
jgi:alpha-amylase